MSPDSRKLDSDEMAELQALNMALKRTRLEEAARNPQSSPWVDWIFPLVLVVLVTIFKEHVIQHLWILVFWFIIDVRRRYTEVHNRIDAILELERLNSQLTGK
ncbi:MAG: hypothetical protein QM627_03030 [Luteolibacter sp.]